MRTVSGQAIVAFWSRGLHTRKASNLLDNGEGKSERPRLDGEQGRRDIHQGILRDDEQVGTHTAEADLGADRDGLAHDDRGEGSTHAEGHRQGQDAGPRGAASEVLECQPGKGPAQPGAGRAAAVPLLKGSCIGCSSGVRPWWAQ